MIVDRRKGNILPFIPRDIREYPWLVNREFLNADEHCIAAVQQIKTISCKCIPDNDFITHAISTYYPHNHRPKY